MHYRMSYLLSDKETSQIKIKEALSLTGLTKQEFLSQVSKLDYSLHQDELTLQPLNPLEWTEAFLGVNANDLELTIEERQCMVYLMVYSEVENASVYHFQDFLRVSRGTVLADIKELRNDLSKEDIEIQYDRNSGYFLSGNSNNMIRRAKNCISILLQSSAGKFALHYFTTNWEFNLYAYVRDQIEYFIQQSNYELVLSRLDEMVYFTIFSKKFLQTQVLTAFDGEEEVKQLSLFKTSQKILQKVIGSEVSDTNLVVYTICLLSVLQGDIHEPAFDFLLQLSAEIIHRMESYAAVQFNKFRELLFDVYNHLVPAFFRIKYGLVISNTLSDSIYSEYKALFELTEKALEPLEKATNKSIPDDEIAYFTILFGGAIKADDKNKFHPDNIRALIVCPNGVSSSLILETELKQLFPSMNFTGVSTTEGIQDISDGDYDLIFSTVPIEKDNKSVYVVKPIMNQLMKNQLINKVQEDWLIPGFSFPNTEEIIEAMKPYVSLKKGATEEQLYKAINRKISRQFEASGDKPRLEDLLVEDHILFREKVYRYEDGIRIAAHPLLEKGYINEQYIEAMIENVKRRGPYIYLNNGVALPHARAEDGSFKVGFSLLVLNEPVALANDTDYMVDHFIVLSVIDNRMHLDALSDLNALMRNKPLLNTFLKSKDSEEIVNLLKKI